MPAKTLRRLLLIGVCFAAAALAFGQCSHFIEVDRCLDAGGSWNSAEQTCSHTLP